jgi:hypothetical protein
MSNSTLQRPVSRRPFLLEAGEALLVTNDPVRLLINHVSAAKSIGLSQAEFAASRMSPMPMPVNAGRPYLTARRRRLAGVDPRSMWLPVLWLPRRLTDRCRFHVLDGDVVVIDPNGYFSDDPHAVTAPIDGVLVRTETSDAWVIRVALELEASGAFDMESGTWLDVLDTIGVNIDDVDDVARVQRWLDGGADVDLDWLENNYLDDGWQVPRGEEPTWALRSALALYPDLLDATWALGTNSMLNIVEDVVHGVSDGGIADAKEAKFVTTMVCMLSGSLLRWYTNDEAEWWQKMSRTVESFRGTSNDLVVGPLSEIDGRLSRVREDCWPKMEASSVKYRN